MTSAKRPNGEHRSFKPILLLPVCLLFVVIEFLFSSELTKTLTETLKNAAIKIVPSLFPFMVFSKFLCDSGCISILDRTVGRLFSSLFGISKAAAGAVLLGLISGFPVGASTVASLYKSGKLKKSEAERVLFLSHNAGPAFPIAAIGIGMWNSIRFGVAIYLAQLISMVLVSFIIPIGRSKTSEGEYSFVDEKTITESITDAISSSAFSCVRIIGFIVFWRTVSEMLLLLLPDSYNIFGYIITCVFEFSSGAVSASIIGGHVGSVLTGFAVGFGGISAITQAAYFAVPEGLSIKPMVIGKVAQGLICAVLCGISYNLVF